MASISSLGVGANLDLSGLLDQLAAAERAPVVALQQQQISYTAKLTAYSRLQGALGTLQTAAARLSDPKLFGGVKAASSAADVLSASASASAVPGVYSTNVAQLAQAQSLVSAGRASATAAVGAGTIGISWRTISGGVLDTASGKYTGADFAADTDRAAVKRRYRRRHTRWKASATPSTPRRTQASPPASSTTAAPRPTGWC